MRWDVIEIKLDLPKSESDLSNSKLDLPNSELDLPNSKSDLSNSKSDLSKYCARKRSLLSLAELQKIVIDRTGVDSNLFAP
jgi:hypothetical protein